MTISTIEQIPGGGTVFTGPHATRLYSLVALKHGLLLEAKLAPSGLKVTRGPSMLARARALTGLRTRDRMAHVGRINVLIEQARAQCVVKEAP